MSSFIGIDFASVDENRPPDWVKARAGGLRFAIIRADYGTWADPTYQRDDDNARAAGVIVGAYLFPVISKTSPSPEVQVASFVKSVGPISKSDFPPTLDVEFPGGIAKTGMTRVEIMAWIRRAIAALKLAYGVMPMLYTSGRVWDSNDSDGLGSPAAPDLIDCPLWLARYPYKTGIPPQLDVSHLSAPPVPKPWGDSDDWFIHQFQGDARGYLGIKQVDLNRFNVMSIGAHGDRVKWAQRRLGMTEGSPGVFDDAMHDSVVSFQKQHGLEADGIIGPATFVALCWSNP